MANRRMFSRSVIDSDSFLEMPLSAQALYFHLGIRADDDGFVSNTKIILRLSGAGEDDLNRLINSGYILNFESGLIAIRHWRIHNFIRSDRYTPTIYTSEKSMVYLDENKVYQYVTPYDNRVSYQWGTQYSIGKDSIDKVREDEESPPCIHKKFFGEYRHVKLTETEYEKLIADFGEENIFAYIKKVDEYCQGKGKKYSDYNLTIRNWIRKDNERNGQNGRIIETVSQGSIYGEYI